MRQPPLVLDKVPDRCLEAWLDEAIRAEDTVELLAELVRPIRPEVVRATERLLAESNPVLDYPGTGHPADSPDPRSSGTPDWNLAPTVRD